MQPVSPPVSGVLRPPGSKSLTNRALIVAALAQGRSRLTGVLDSQDTRVMIDSLRKMGLTVDGNAAEGELAITGCGGHPPAPAADLWLENSGTSIRFLTAFCTLGKGRFRLDGNRRMRERPIADLVDGLKPLGAELHCELNNGCPPVVVTADGLPGGATTVGATVSSQYLSGLLMAAPAALNPVEITLSGELVSEPYVEMTLAVMRAFGVSAERPEPQRFVIPPQTYQARDYAIEPDASAASYFFAAAAVTQGRITVQGLSREALQGDVGFVDLLEQMGCEVTSTADAITVQGRPLRGIEADMNDISDTAQTLACVAPFANGPTWIRNVAHMRLKETDRVAALVTELRKLGQQVEEFPDGLRIDPRPIQPARVATYDDHRMAMSFALIGLRSPGIEIADPECTAKTYPHYFDDLDRLCQTSAERST